MDLSLGKSVSTVPPKMQCVCCRCGMLQTSSTATLCLQVEGNHQSYQCHCFCCVEPPRMKCFHCNAWKDLNVLEAHGPCVTGSKHLFVFSEPWPPFSNNIPHEPLTGMVITFGRSQERNREDVVVEPDVHPEQDPVAVHVDVESQEVEEPVDVKPKISSRAKWVSLGDIRKWNSCIRCGMVKIKQKGWIRHAQICGQDPKYTSRKFFIYLHTISWCGCLVMDTFWDKHSDPEKGTCPVCRLSRKNKKPLPFQPKPPARKNESTLQKQHQSRLISKRKKRRQSLAGNAQTHNISGNITLQLVGS